MKKNTFIILMILIVPLVVYFALTRVENNTTVAEAQVNKPQMIKFASQMCYDCQRLEEVVKRIYPEYADKVSLTEIYVQDNSSNVQNMIRKYEVKLVPTSIFMDKSGNVKARVEGFMDENSLKAHLEEISNG